MELFTRKEAARILKIGLRTLDRRIARDEIECHRLGEGPRAPVRISMEQIAAYLAETRSDQSKPLADRAANIVARK